MTRSIGAEKGNAATSNSRVGANSNAALEVVVAHMKNGRKNGKRPRINDVDDVDLELMRYMLAGYSSTQISRKTGMPLSTVQRRTRNLFVRGYTIQVVHLNFKKFGLRRGLLQFKCKSADLKEAAEKISAIKGVESVGAYLGSLDVIANVVYSDSKEVLGIIAEAQKLNLITDATWSEEIHSMPI